MSALPPITDISIRGRCCGYAHSTSVSARTISQQKRGQQNAGPLRKTMHHAGGMEIVPTMLLEIPPSTRNGLAYSKEASAMLTLSAAL